MSQSSQRANPRFVPILFAVLFLVALLPATPAAVAGPTPMIVCGKVINSAGWGIAGATITFISLSSPPSTAPLAGPVGTTRSDGTFEVSGLFQEYAYAPNIRPAGYAADHAAYLPWPAATDGNDRIFRSDSAQSATCASGPGFALHNGLVTLDSPEQGFVDVRVTDGGAAGPWPIAGASVSTDLGVATTDATGDARFSCLLGTTTAVTVTQGSRQYLQAERDGVPCSDTSAATVPVTLWRKPVVVAIEITDAGTRDPTIPGGQEQGLGDAIVRVVRTPSSLAPLELSGSCAAVPPTADLTVGVSRDNMPPYHCVATTDSRGTATLALPWANATTTTFRFAASKAGYATRAADRALAESNAAPTAIAANNAATESARAVQTPTLANAYQRFTLIPLNATNPQPNVTVKQQIVDYQGLPISGVDVQLDGISKIATATDPQGYFTASVVGSSYNITLQAPEYNVRTCPTSWINGINGTSQGVINLSATSANCFSLVHTDKAAVAGTAMDGLTAIAIQGLQFCTTEATPHCATTGVDGTYALEAAAGTNVHLSPTSWTLADSAPLVADQRLTFPSAGLDRTTRDVNVIARDATTNAALPNALVCAVPSTVMTGANANCPAAGPFTDANGQRTFTAVAWTKRSSLPDFHLADSVTVRGERENANPHYARGTLTFDVLDTDASPTLTILLSEASHVATTLTARDAHTNAVIPVLVTVADPANQKCGPVCSGTSPGNLDLYVGPTLSEIHTYNGSATDPAGLFVDNVTPAPFVAGAAANIVQPRTTTYVAVKLLDAHTGGPIQGLAVRVVGGAAVPTFDCLVPGSVEETSGGTTFSRVCRGTSLANGTVSPDPAPVATNTAGTRFLNIPWSITTNEECFQVTAGAGRVALYNTSTGSNGDITTNGRHTTGDVDADQELVDFQQTTACFIVPQQQHSAPPARFQIFVSRAAATPLTGTVVNGVTLSPIPGASIVPVAERAHGGRGTPNANPSDPLAYSSFACDPSATSSTARFPQCAGVATDATGAFSLTLPKLGLAGGATLFATTSTPLTPDNTWDLKATAPGYQPERSPLVAGGSTTSVVTLWPATFTATATFTQDGQTNCGGSYSGDIIVTLTDLDSGAQQFAKATRNGSTCTATFSNVSWSRVVQNVSNVEPIGKTFDIYALNTTYGDATTQSMATGAVVALLGPSTTNASFVARTGSTSGFEPTVNPGYITGTVRDLDALPGVGAAGVTVTATREGGLCSVSGNTAGHPESATLTGPTGAYALPVTCFGTYTVATNAPASYQSSAVKHVSFVAGGMPPTADFALNRVRSDLTVTVLEATSNAPVAGIPVDVAPVDNIVHPAIVQTDANGTAVFTLPWGAFTVTTKPTGPTAGTSVPAIVLPAGTPATSTAFVATAPSTGSGIAGRVVDDDSAPNARLLTVTAPIATGPGIAGVLVTATKAGTSCLGMGQVPAVFRTVTDTAGRYNVTIPSNCAGNFTLTFDHPSSASPQRLYQAAPAQQISYDPTVGTTGADAHLRRTTATLWMVPVNLTSAVLVGFNTVNNTIIQPLGIDGNVSLDAKQFQGQLVYWTNVPWGAYYVSPQPPQGSPLPARGMNWGVPEVMFIPPGGGSSSVNPTECYVVYAP